MIEQAVCNRCKEIYWEECKMPLIDRYCRDCRVIVNQSEQKGCLLLLGLMMIGCIVFGACIAASQWIGGF